MSTENNRLPRLFWIYAVSIILVGCTMSELAKSPRVSQQATSAITSKTEVSTTLTKVTLLSAGTGLPTKTLIPTPTLPYTTSTATVSVIKPWVYEQIFKTEYVNVCAAVAPDKKYIMLGEFSSGQIAIWDTSSRKIEKFLQGAMPCISMAISPDGKYFAYGLKAVGMNEHIILYIGAMPDGELSQGIVNFYNVLHLAFSPDSQQLAVINGAIQVYQLKAIPAFKNNVVSSTDVEPWLLLKPKTDDAIITAEYSPDGALIAGGTNNGDVLLWKIDSGELITTLSLDASCKDKRYSDVRTISFSPDGSRLASVFCQDVLLWDVINGRLINRIDTGVYTDVIAFSSDGKSLITGSQDTKIWDIESGRSLCTLVVDTERILAISYSSDMAQVLAATSEGSVVGWPIQGLCNP